MNRDNPELNAYLSIGLLEKNTTFLIDSGSDVSLIKANQLRKGIYVNIDDNILLNGVTAGHLKTLGAVEGDIFHFEQFLNQKFHVASSNFSIKQDGILGYDFLKNHRVELNCHANKTKLVVATSVDFELTSDGGKVVDLNMSQVNKDLEHIKTTLKMLNQENVINEDRIHIKEKAIDFNQEQIAKDVLVVNNFENDNLVGDNIEEINSFLGKKGSKRHTQQKVGIVNLNFCPVIKPNKEVIHSEMVAENFDKVPFIKPVIDVIHSEMVEEYIFEKKANKIIKPNIFVKGAHQEDGVTQEKVTAQDLSLSLEDTKEIIRNVKAKTNSSSETPRKVNIHKEKEFLCNVRLIDNKILVGYMNSVLKALFYLDNFMSWLFANKQNHKNYCNNTDCIVCLCLNIFEEMKLGTYVVKPIRLFEILTNRLIKFNKCDQNSHEFLLYLIKCLDEDLLRVNKGILFRDYFLNMFKGDMYIQVSCNNCENILKLDFKFKELHLTKNKLNTSLNELIKLYFNEVQVNDYKCKNCNMKVSIIKKYAIKELPDILCIIVDKAQEHFKDIILKIDKNINLNSFVDDNKHPITNYNLKAILNKVGDKKGHYYRRKKGKIFFYV